LSRKELKIIEESNMLRLLDSRDEDSFVYGGTAFVPPHDFRYMGHPTHEKHQLGISSA